MLYTINQLIREVSLEGVYRVYDVFKNHFGEDFVDLQGVPTEEDVLSCMDSYSDVFSFTPLGHDDLYDASESAWDEVKVFIRDCRPFIIVWWPHVTVTNENDKSIEIQDLYAKVDLTFNGHIPYEGHGFYLLRARWNKAQWESRYSHSHIPSLDIDRLGRFQSPCLGTGPINNTILTLKNSNEEISWMLFCQELSVYVTVESLTGGPYRRLEDVGIARTLYGFRSFDDYYYTPSVGFFLSVYSSSTLKDFIRWYLENGHLQFRFTGGKFCIGLSYYDFMLDISNAFIEWYNTTSTEEYRTIEELLNNEILVKSIVIEGKFCSMGTGQNSLPATEYQNRHILYFKGRDIKSVIDETAEGTPEETILLHHSIAIKILQNILKTINYHYHNEYNNKRQGAKASAKTYQRSVYL